MTEWISYHQRDSIHSDSGGGISVSRGLHLHWWHCRHNNLMPTLMGEALEKEKQGRIIKKKNCAHHDCDVHFAGMAQFNCSPLLVLCVV